MRSEIKSIKVDDAKVNQQLGDLDTFCQSISDTIDEFHSHTVYCTKTISELKGQNSSFRETLEDIKHENTRLRETMTDLKCRNMQENLIFVGIDEQEPGQYSENCEDTLKKFLETSVQNDPTLNTCKQCDGHECVICQSTSHRRPARETTPNTCKI